MTTTTETHRLPVDVTPTRYELTIGPDLDAATFDGRVSVQVTVHEPTERIVCNAAELEFGAVWLETSGGRVDATAMVDERSETVAFDLAETVASGPATLHVEYRGILNDRLRGFYRSTFTDPDGRERTIAVTQFEATDARRAFPCWDEPVHKAVFGVTLEIADDLFAVSNSPEVARETLTDGRVRITYADTMPMSTYLVAFVVGPLEATAAVDVDGIPLRVVHTPGQAHLTTFALEVGAFALRYFADYYGIAYPGEKLDMVAVPDFAFGAMENLGCVTYRETMLLIDPQRATQAELSTVVDVIAHELAHMWFGDLVTMSWWNGIWLNEAFATFMEMKCADAFRPDWQRWMHFGSERTTAFDTDALAETRPIEYPVQSPEDAEGMFDVLTYQKGSAVVRMLEQYLGADSFRDGIRRYLLTHQYANTETGDLWDALESETGEPVRAVMDSWIFQGGFPLVTVGRRDGSLEVRQEIFRYDRTSTDARWHVPIVIRHGDDTSRLVLDVTGETVPAGSGMVVANAGGHGFYRVHYASDLHELVVGGLTELAPLERYSVLDDALALCLRGDVAGAEVLGLVRRMADIGERDLSIWELAADALDTLGRVVPDAERSEWEAWQVETLRPLFDELGPTPVPSEDDRRRALRGLVVQLLGTAGDDEIVDRCRAWFDQSTADPASVEPGLAAGALRVMAARADAAVFEAVLDRFRHGDTPQEQVRHLYAAARAEDPAVFDRYLDLLLGDAVRSQNLAFACRAALHNRVHGIRAWAFVRDHWQTLHDRLPFNSMHRLVEGVTTIDDDATAREIEAFFVDHPVPQAERKIAQHLERMRVSIALRRREADRLVTSLR